MKSLYPYGSPVCAVIYQCSMCFSCYTFTALQYVLWQCIFHDFEFGGEGVSTDSWLGVVNIYQITFISIEIYYEMK